MGQLMDRIKRLVAANLRELLEAAKDPEIELLEFVANLEHSCGEAKTEMVDAVTGAKRLERQLSETRKQAELWNKKALAALKAGEDDLAREALRRKAKTEALASHIQSELKEQWELADSFRQTLEDLQGKLKETQTQRDRLLSQGDRAAQAQRVRDIMKEKGWWSSDATADRLSQEILEKKHRFEAYQELHRSSLEVEFQRLSSQKDIEGELRDLKKNLSEDNSK
jgi:phage shock protein A